MKNLFSKNVLLSSFLIFFTGILFFIIAGADLQRSMAIFSMDCRQIITDAVADKFDEQKLVLH